MNKNISEAFNIFEAQRLAGELVVYHKAVFRDLWGNELWLLSDQRLLRIYKGTAEEKPLFEPGEMIIYHESAESQFSGNVHLLTERRLLVLNIGARNYLLHSIALSTIAEVDITGIRDGALNTLLYALKIKVSGVDEPIEIKYPQGPVDSIKIPLTEYEKRQQLYERFPRKIREIAGVKFAVPKQRTAVSGGSLVDFYSRSDLVWPLRCSACYQKPLELLFDSYSPENPWLAAHYHLGFGLIPQFTYQIPYCPDCYKDRLVFEPKNRAVKTGPAQSNGARVELSFENHIYAQDFVQVNGN